MSVRVQSAEKGARSWFFSSQMLPGPWLRLPTCDPARNNPDVLLSFDLDVESNSEESSHPRDYKCLKGAPCLAYQSITYSRISG